MEKLFRDDLSQVIRAIPEQDYNVQKVMELFQEYIPTIAGEFGIVYMNVKITRPGKERTSLRETRVTDVYRTDSEVNARDRFYDFTIGNGGHVEVCVGIDARTNWDRRQEQDMDTLVKTIYLMIGRAQAMHDLLKAVMQDPITEAASRAGLNRFIGQQFAKGAFWNMCSNFLNVRNMKLYNERYGDRGGNMLLKKYAQTLQEFVGRDGIVARLGGDNFFVMLDAAREQAFLELIENLVVELSNPLGVTSQIKMESRVGYYMHQKGDDEHDVMDNANIAQRVAKQNRTPDIVRYEPEMKQQMFFIKELEENVPAAIKNKEFMVYYQPKAHLLEDEKYELCGAEALIRWKKNDAMIMPMSFIPVLERNGMIVQVDFYMLEQVCIDLRELLDQGIEPVPISVNFSRRHLQYDDIADRIYSVIKKYEIDPSYLEIEITESYDTQDMGALSRFEQRMHGYGMDVSVDDFGSGFSSIKMIKQIATDTIKIDKSLIDGIGAQNQEDEIILGHVIRMIKELGKKIVAEGVETKEQAKFLWENGCDTIQGYLYAKPMPKDDAFALLKEKRAREKKEA